MGLGVTCAADVEDSAVEIDSVMLLLSSVFKKSAFPHLLHVRLVPKSKLLELLEQNFLHSGSLSCHQTNSVIALKWR